MYIVDVSFYDIDFYCFQSTMFSFKCHRAILESTWFDMRKKIENPLGRLIVNNYYAEFQTACDHRDVKFELLYLITYFILSRWFFSGKGRRGKNVQMMFLSFFHAGQEDL